MRIGWTLALTLALAGCGGDCLAPGGCDRPGTAGTTTGGATFNGSGGAPAGALQTVTYRVDGTAPSATVTYASADGSTQQAVVVPPWQFERSAGSGDFLYVSAQNDGGTGSLTVTVTVAGQVFRTATSDAPFGIATASDSCC